jgi:hypothetical protein
MHHGDACRVVHGGAWWRWVVQGDACRVVQGGAWWRRVVQGDTCRVVHGGAGWRWVVQGDACRVGNRLRGAWWRWVVQGGTTYQGNPVAKTVAPTALPNTTGTRLSLQPVQRGATGCIEIQVLQPITPPSHTHTNVCTPLRTYAVGPGCSSPLKPTQC